MNKIVVKSLVGQNGESLGAYVDYGDFCKMQSEYEEQIEKLKCCGNCKKQNTCIKHNNFFYPEMTNPINYGCDNLSKWELAE